MSENPHAAAQRFLNANDLPLTYVDEVVKFIEKNSAGVNISSNNEYVDPYTGEVPYFLCRRSDADFLNID